MDGTRYLRLLVLLGAGWAPRLRPDRRRRWARLRAVSTYRENAIIDKVLSTQVCVERRAPGLLPGRSAQRRAPARRRRSPPRRRRPRPSGRRRRRRCASTRRSPPAPRSSARAAAPTAAATSPSASPAPASPPARRSASPRACASPDGRVDAGGAADGRRRARSAALRRARAPAAARRRRRRACSSRCSSSSRRRRRFPSASTSLGQSGTDFAFVTIDVRARGHHHRTAADGDGDHRDADRDGHAGRARRPTATPDVAGRRPGHHVLRRGARRQLFAGAERVRRRRPADLRAALRLRAVAGRRGTPGPEPAPDRCLRLLRDRRARSADHPQPAARRRQHGRLRPPAARHRRRAGRDALRLPR